MFIGLVAHVSQGSPYTMSVDTESLSEVILLLSSRGMAMVPSFTTPRKGSMNSRLCFTAKMKWMSMYTTRTALMAKRDHDMPLLFCSITKPEYLFHGQGPPVICV